MLKYDLQRLGGIGFQDVVAAVAIKVLGAHVRSMGRGKDGGRDMLINNGVIVCPVVTIRRCRLTTLTA